MRLIAPSAAIGVAVTLLVSISVSGQQTQTPPGVRLGLNYAVGSKPGVLVLPLPGDDADSVRTILQRDLDNDDRVTVVAMDMAAAKALIPAPNAKFNFAVFAKMGVAAP